MQVGGPVEHALLACVTPAPGPSSVDGSCIVTSGTVNCGASIPPAVSRYLLMSSCRSAMLAAANA
eukprot:7480096-Prorocentrum_lima.AAC.1